MASDGRSYVGGYFAMKLDDINCGIIQKFEGGDIEGTIVTLPMAHDYYVKKHLGNVKYNEFTVQMGLSMGEPVRKWIEASLQMNFLRKDGELQAADFKRDVRQVREFKQALLTEIGFPACDGAAKDPAFMSLKFAPETTRNLKGSGKVEAPVDVKQKLFFGANFRMLVDGLEKSCAKVAKVGGITIKQSTTVDEIGDARDYQREPGKIDFPDLDVTVSEEYAHDWWAGHEDFVIKGNNDDAKHKNGSLAFLDPTRAKSLLELTFSQLGIYKGTAEASENNSDKIRRVNFKCYCENIVAKFGG